MLLERSLDLETIIIISIVSTNILPGITSKPTYIGRCDMIMSYWDDHLDCCLGMGRKYLLDN